MENVTKPWNDLWLGDRGVVSEERLQQLMFTAINFKIKFQEVRNSMNQKLLNWQ